MDFITVIYTDSSRKNKFPIIVFKLNTESQNFQYSSFENIGPTN